MTSPVVSAVSLWFSGMLPVEQLLIPVVWEVLVVQIIVVDSSATELGKPVHLLACSGTLV